MIYKKIEFGREKFGFTWFLPRMISFSKICFLLCPCRTSNRVLSSGYPFGANINPII